MWHRYLVNDVKHMHDAKDIAGTSKGCKDDCPSIERRCTADSPRTMQCLCCYYNEKEFAY